MKKDYKKQALKNRALTNNYLLFVFKILSAQIKDLSLLYFCDRKNKLIHYVSPILVLSLLNLLSNSVNAQVTGTTFRDYNGNGIKDVNEIGIGGISVTVYNATGTAFGPVTTAIDGTYTTPSVAGQVRIEFTVPVTIGCFSENVFSTARGSSSATSVQFVTAPVINVDFGVNNPEDYNLGINNTQLFTPCYVNGDPLASGTGTTSGSMDWFVGFPYSNLGTTPPTQKMNGSIIGSVWGVAYSKQAKKIFTSAFLKRHSGLGSLGSGGIYLLTPTAMSFTVSNFFDMDNNSFNTAGTPVTRTRANGASAYGNGSSYQISGNNDRIDYLGGTDALSGSLLGLGVIGTNAERGHVSDPTQASYDPAAFDQIGKVGLGSIEISDDGKYLFVVNLLSKKLFRLTLNDAYNPTEVISITSYDMPVTNCTNGVFRPFATKFYRGKLYVGGVCTGENGGQNTVNGATDLYAYVFELNSSTGAATFNNTPVISYPLNYRKGKVRDDSDPLHWKNYWSPWEGHLAGDFLTGDTNPQPILSDIDFTENGDIIMDFMDRGGHQYGDDNYKFFANLTWTEAYIIGGDILIAGKNCGSDSFTLENGGSFMSGNGNTYTATTALNGEGPGGGEFFTADNFRLHQENSMGSVAVLPGLKEAYLTVMDPSDYNTGGTRRFSTVNGTEIPSQWSGYTLYERLPAFGKANGLGEVELNTVLSPIEIGNRVWDDTDKDGIQDAGEAGISGITVTLCDALGTPIVGATATTDANGSYYFSSATATSTASAIYGLNLTFNTGYILKFPLTSGTKLLTTNDLGGNDLSDSDAGADGKITFTIGSAGQNNHTYDVGYRDTPCPTPNCGTVMVQKN